MISQQQRGEYPSSLSGGRADRPEVVLADAAGVSAGGPGEAVLEDVDAVDEVAVAAHEVELVLAVGEAARPAAEARHLLRLLHAVALALEGSGSLSHLLYSTLQHFSHLSHHCQKQS